jgi:LPS sulfotransferase NodH
MLPNFAELFDRPVIILAAPRSGSTLLFETLAAARNTWTIGGESHQIIEGVQSLNPNSGQVDSNRLTADHVNEQLAQFVQPFNRLLKDRWPEFFRHRTSGLRFIEKTPKNSLRLPFMDRVFPDALYVFLFRDVRANLSSMMEAWKARRWVTYPNLKGWRPPLVLLLPPGWQKLRAGHWRKFVPFNGRVRPSA